MKPATKHMSIGFIPEMAVAALRETGPKTLTTRMSGLAEINEAPDVWKISDRDSNENVVLFNEKTGDGTLVICRYKVGESRRLLTTWAVPRCLDDLKPSRIDFAGTAFWHAGMGPKPAWAGKNRPGNFLPGEERHRMPEVEIVGVSIARMQDITEAQAVAEGFVRTMSPELLTIILKGGHSFQIAPNYVHGVPKVGESMDGREVTHVEPFPGRVLGTARDNFAATIARIHPAKKAKKGEAAKPNGWDANPWCWHVAFKLVSRGGAL